MTCRTTFRFGNQCVDYFLSGCVDYFFADPPVGCVNYSINPETELLTWDPYFHATGYNVYSAPPASPSELTLLYSNVPLLELPVEDCVWYAVTAITAGGESSMCPAVRDCDSAAINLITPIYMGTDTTPITWTPPDLSGGSSFPFNGVQVGYINFYVAGRAVWEDGAIVTMTVPQSTDQYPIGIAKFFGARYVLSTGEWKWLVSNDPKRVFSADVDWVGADRIFNFDRDALEQSNGDFALQFVYDNRYVLINGVQSMEVLVGPPPGPGFALYSGGGGVIYNDVDGHPWIVTLTSGHIFTKDTGTDPLGHYIWSGNLTDPGFEVDVTAGGWVAESSWAGTLE